MSHVVGSRFTGTGTINYFHYNNTSGDTLVDPPFNTYAILEGTPNALFPRGTRLVRLIDQAEFDQLSAAGALPAGLSLPATFTGSGATISGTPAAPGVEPTSSFTVKGTDTQTQPLF